MVLKFTKIFKYKIKLTKKLQSLAKVKVIRVKIPIGN